MFQVGICSKNGRYFGDKLEPAIYFLSLVLEWILGWLHIVEPNPVR